MVSVILAFALVLIPMLSVVSDFSKQFFEQRGQMLPEFADVPSADHRFQCSFPAVSAK